MEYEAYKEHIATDIAEQIAELRCQPVLFFGSGMSRRYFEAPNWTELLQKLADDCPKIEQPYAYYAQSCSSEPEVGSIFADFYRQWAWSTGRNQFPDNLFEANVHPEAFLKNAVASYLKSILQDDHAANLSGPLAEEISALGAIQPHAVLTTNYDTFLEQVFPNYTVVVGQNALKGMPFSVGEIFKFHGCVNDIEEIVLTSEDYQAFKRKKKFIAARLLSLFNEHPLLIAGYGAGDVNVRALLSDIDEALALPGSLIKNIYFLEFDRDAEEKSSLPTEKLIQIEDNRSVRVKLIVASDFRWVFEAFESPDNLTNIPANLLRAILARSYELVRTDVPKTTLEVDYDFLERKLDNPTEFAKLFGITTVADPSADTARYPYSATELGKQLGGSSWHLAIALIKQVEQDTGINIKSGDNKFHRQNRVNKSLFH